jgi:hypothetical protein
MVVDDGPGVKYVRPNYLIIYGLPTYLKVSIHHLRIYPKATYGLPTYLPMDCLSIT